MSIEANSNIIELNDVVVYLNDRLVLDNINLKVPQGKITAVIGPNGAGKTTLLKVILGLVKPASGTVRVFGKDPEKLGKDRKRIAYVPQIRSVDMGFPIRVFDAVLMGRYPCVGLFGRPSKKDREIVEEVMAKIDITSIADKPLSKLSGGQVQRVFIARALASNPELLFLDEPTNGVDQVHSSNFYDILKGFKNDDMTVMIVSHDVGVVASFVDAIACINKRLILHDVPKAINNHVVEEMYGCGAVLFNHGEISHMVVCEDK
ncbi:MAG: ABC transporter ATP-binding protein [bacterium]|nr:ABC transporter ATP-binding protein [bacterium]